MGERATTDVFEEHSSDLICCRSCEWYTSRLEMIEKGEVKLKRMKGYEPPSHPEPAFYCESYERCWQAVLAGAKDMVDRLLKMEVVNDISTGPTHVSAIIGAW